MAGLLPRRNRVQSVYTNFLDDLTEFYNQSVTSQDQNKDIVKWIEHNRWIDGKPWSFQASGPVIEWGENDIRLDVLPRPYLYQFLNDRTPERSVIKCRQCIVGDTVVYTYEDNNLILDTIENLFKRKYTGKVVYNVNDRNSVCDVKEVWYSGEKDVYEVKLFNGFKLQCSLDHKLFDDRLKKLTPLKQLKVGDKINVYEDGFGEYKLPEGHPELFGYMLSDGTFHTTRLNRIACVFRNTNKEYIDEFCNLIGDEYIGVTKFNNNWSDCYDVRIKKDSKFRKQLFEFGCLDQIYEKKRFPYQLLNLNRDQTALLINRLFAGNGYYSKLKRNNKNSYVHEIGIGSLSYTLLTQIQLLLQRFGINSSIKISLGKQSKRQFWKLVLSTKRDNVLKFMVDIGIKGKINSEDIESIRNECKRLNSHKCKDKNEIVSIKYIGVRDTYDLAVSDTDNHVFYANGILVSNSEFTENHINEALYWLMTRQSTRISHIFPTDEMGNAMSNEKIRTAIDGSPALVHQLKSKAVHNYTFKNQSFYSVIGALKKAGGRGGSRDILIFDEVDSMSDSIFGVYEEMLSHSSLKYVRKYSTGTVPGVGIDKIVSEGTGYDWHIVCPKCKKSQTFTFPDNIINFFTVNELDPSNSEYMKRLNKVYIGCKHCKAYIDRGSRHYIDTSYWEARRPEMIDRHASYHVVMAMIPWKTGKEILRRFHALSSYEWQFYNEVWGVAFLKGDYTLTELELRACEQSWCMAYQRLPVMQNVSIGIDWGESSSWVVVIANGIDVSHPGRKCVVYIEEINKHSLEHCGLKNTSLNHVVRVKQIVEAFHPQIIVNDANGLGVDRNSDLIQTYDERAWGCFFDTAEMARQMRKSTLQEPAWMPARHKVTISKVNTWKTLQAEIRRGHIFFPSSQSQDAPAVNAFIHHMQSLGIQSRFDVEKNREFEVVVKLHPNDHLADAFMYANIGFHKVTGYKTGTVPGIVLPGYSGGSSVLGVS